MQTVLSRASSSTQMTHECSRLAADRGGAGRRGGILALRYPSLHEFTLLYPGLWTDRPKPTDGCQESAKGGQSGKKSEYFGPVFDRTRPPQVDGAEHSQGEDRRQPGVATVGRVSERQKGVTPSYVRSGVASLCDTLLRRG